MLDWAAAAMGLVEEVMVEGAATVTVVAAMVVAEIVTAAAERWLLEPTAYMQSQTPPRGCRAHCWRQRSRLWSTDAL